MDDKKRYCTFYIVRHGEAEFNVKKIVHGHVDSPLTEKGKEQARVLGRTFRNIRFDRVFSSDLLRAKRTAEIIALEHKLAVETTQLLRERTFGKLDGQPLEALKAFEKLLQELSAKEREQKLTTHNFESNEKLVGRFIQFVRETAVAHPGKTILVVSHGGLMRTFLIHVGFIKHDQLPPGAIENTAYVRFLSDGVDFFIEQAVGVSKKED